MCCFRRVPQLALNAPITPNSCTVTFYMGHMMSHERSHGCHAELIMFNCCDKRRLLCQQVCVWGGSPGQVFRRNQSRLKYPVILNLKSAAQRLRIPLVRPLLSTLEPWKELFYSHTHTLLLSNLVLLLLSKHTHKHPLDFFIFHCFCHILPPLSPTLRLCVCVCVR